MYTRRRGASKGDRPRYPSPVRAALLVLVLACGCDPVDPVDGGGACADDGRVEVGAGGSRLIALPESGGELPIVLGSQGGIHVVVGAWVRDLPLEMDLTYRLEDPVTAATIGEPTTLHLTPSLFRPDGARQQRHPDLLVLNNESPDVTELAGRSALLVAEARTAAARACDLRQVVLVAPP